MPLKNPNLPRARIITDMGPPFWIVFQGMYRGYGRCGRHNGTLEDAYRSWCETWDTPRYRPPLADLSTR